MDYFPAFLRLEGRRCLLVGGGTVAARKAGLLLSAGAELTVVAPTISPAMVSLAGSSRIKHQARAFQRDDVEGQWLVVSATGDAAVEREVSEAASAAGVFCNGVDDPASCSFITPAIVDRSPVIIAVSSGGSAPVLARVLRSRIEALLPSGLGRIADIAARWRVRVKRRLRSLAARRRFWERFFAAAVDPSAADTTLGAMLEDGVDAAGQAWLVGAGPGDPDLLTLRALQCLQAADVIVHDRLVSNEVLALARRDADRVPVGKTPGSRRNSQQRINALLVELVSAGKRVCRLKGGDPFIFGRGGEEAAALEAAGLSYAVVPGITAASGCAAAAGIPLTHRDFAQSVVLLTAHGRDSVDTLDWPSLARDRQTLAVYMGVRRFPELMNRLIAHGRPADTPVAIVERGTTPGQRVLRGTLGQLTLLARAHRVEAPALLIIGEVARLGAAAVVPSAGHGDANTAVSAIHRTANQKQQGITG